MRILEAVQLVAVLIELGGFETGESEVGLNHATTDRTRKGPFWWPGISPTYDTTSPPAPKGKVSLWFFPREVVTVT